MDNRWKLVKPIKVPKYLYHATYRPYLQSILDNGLGNTLNKNWGDSKAGIVYLADDEYVAYSYAEIAEDVVDEALYDDIVVLVINTDFIDCSLLYIDRNNLDSDTFEYHGVIDAEAIESILE